MLNLLKDSDIKILLFKFFDRDSPTIFRRRATAQIELNLIFLNQDKHLQYLKKIEFEVFRVFSLV